MLTDLMPTRDGSNAACGIRVIQNSILSYYGEAPVLKLHNSFSPGGTAAYSRGCKPTENFRRSAAESGRHSSGEHQ